MLRGRPVPEEFGAIGDGVTDDTAAIQAWISASTRAGRVAAVLPPRSYAIQPNSITISGYLHSIRGAGKSSELVLLAAGDAIRYRADVPGGESIIAGIRFRAASGFNTGSCAIRMYAVVAGTGVNIGSISILDNTCSNMDDFVVFDDNGTNLFTPTQPVQNYFGFQIRGNNTNGSAGNNPKYAVRFVGGSGGHTQISENNFSCTEYCIFGGDVSVGFGDTDITNNQLLGANGKAAVNLTGPSDPLGYNRKLQITGNDVDGMVQNTLVLTNFSYGLVANNNMQSGVSDSMTNCYHMRQSDAALRNFTEDTFVTTASNSGGTAARNLFVVGVGGGTAESAFSGYFVEIEIAAVMFGFGVINLKQTWFLRRSSVNFISPHYLASSVMYPTVDGGGNPIAITINASGGGATVAFNFTQTGVTGSTNLTVSVRVTGPAHTYGRL